MKQICVISGKGGTGKTTITASFAALAEDVVIADCDVDAADLHLLLKPRIKEKQGFRGSKVAVIDEDKCTMCGICEENCRFDAITDFRINPIFCEGCGVCVVSCDEKAITLEEKVSGYVFISDTKYGPLSHARLNAAEESSGKLITLVRNNAVELAKRSKMVLIDGPPGIGCPVIASISGIDLALIVTEPTQSGLHDLKRVLSVVRHFGVKPLVCINKYDLNTENTEKIERFCAENKIEVVGRISFDPVVTEAMVFGKPVVEYSPKSKVSEEIKEVWNKKVKVLYG